MSNTAWTFTVCAILSLFTPFAAGRTADPPHPTLSPYFYVDSGDATLDPFPLKSTEVHAEITGPIAGVRVTQVYENEGTRPLECIYVFPASTRAAVHAVRMKIGERTVEARIERRDRARKDYEDARRQGRTASLLEQQRPNVFQMKVANILPGDVIKVELEYTELLVPTEGIYEFVFPTVVGPRYSNQLRSQAPESERWVENPYLKEGTATTYTFALKAHLSMGLPIRDLACPSHKVDVRYHGPASAEVSLSDSERAGGNRDFVLRHRLAGDEIDSGLVLYKGAAANYFLLTVQPPARVPPRKIPPREYIFIVDVSGSMHGYPLEVSKELVRKLIESLRGEDRLNVLLFSGGSAVMAEPSVPATPANIQAALGLIDRQRGGGGTELLPALERALALPRAEKTGSRIFVIATDGYVTVEEETFDLIRERLGEAAFFPFGIGHSVNRYLIEGMARAGMGEPFVVLARTWPGRCASRLNGVPVPVVATVALRR